MIQFFADCANLFFKQWLALESWRRDAISLFMWCFSLLILWIDWSRDALIRILIFARRVSGHDSICAELSSNKIFGDHHKRHANTPQTVASQSILSTRWKFTLFLNNTPSGYRKSQAKVYHRFLVFQSFDWKLWSAINWLLIMRMAPVCSPSM